MLLKTRMEKIINSGYKNTGGIVVLKDGEKVYEDYFNGCTANSTLNVFSVTKSVISILIGIAIEKGYIKNIDQNVLEFFPDYKVIEGEKAIQNIKLKDLLTMTAPYKYKDKPSDYEKYFESDDWVKASLDSLGGSGEIGRFRYAGLIGPDIFTGIIANTTGKSVLDFATEYLFEPLGISEKNNIILRNKDEQLDFLKVKDCNGWLAGPTGINTGGWGLTLTTMEMAKIGQLYLDGGICEGKQIISSKWIEESTIKHSRCDEWKMSYGYLWWIIDEKEHAYAAMGDSGNVIYVNEKKHMVISISALFMHNAKDRIKLIKKYIEPVFQ